MLAPAAFTSWAGSLTGAARLLHTPRPTTAPSSSRSPDCSTSCAWLTPTTSPSERNNDSGPPTLSFHRRAHLLVLCFHRLRRHAAQRPARDGSLWSSVLCLVHSRHVRGRLDHVVSASLRKAVSFSLKSRIPQSGRGIPPTMSPSISERLLDCPGCGGGAGSSASPSECAQRTPVAVVE